MTVIHASAAAVAGQGVLILGASGAGKSTLLVQLLALGAGLIGDDRVRIALSDDVLTAHPTPNLRGMVEVRGVGLLAVPQAAPAPIRLVVDLDQPEPERLPPFRQHHDFGTPLELVLGKGNFALAPAIWLMLQGARVV